MSTEKMFLLDACHLKWLRWLLGAAIILVAGCWLSDLPFFLCDDGPLPRSAILRTFPSSRYGLSIHMLGARLPYETILTILQALCGLAILANYRVRAAFGLAWFLTVSAMNRCPILAPAAMQTLSVTLLWSVFQPWDLKEGRTETVAGVIFCLQVWGTAIVTANLRVPPDSHWVWVGYLAPLCLFAPLRALRVGGYLALIGFYCQQFLDPAFALMALIPVCGLFPVAPSPTCIRPERRVLKSLMLIMALASAAATCSTLFTFPLPRPLWALSEAFSLTPLVPTAADDGVQDLVADVTFRDQSTVPWRLEGATACLKRDYQTQLASGQAALLRDSYVRWISRQAESRSGKEVERITLYAGKTQLMVWLPPKPVASGQKEKSKDLLIPP